MGSRKKFEAYWFCTGLFGTTATQLRLPHMPLGFGVSMLALWMYFITLSYIKGHYGKASKVTMPLLWFWFFGFLFMFIGLLIAYHTGNWDRPTKLDSGAHSTPDSVTHDTFAFLFSALLFLLLSIHENVNSLTREIAKGFYRLTSIAMFLMYLYALSHQQIGSLQLWYYNRFIGWTTNPNELSMLIGIAVMISLYYVLNAESAIARLVDVVLLGLLVTVGVATGSDALFSAWIVSGPVLIVLLWYRKAFAHRASALTGVLLKIFLPLAILSVVLLVLALRIPVYSTVRSFILGMKNNGDQGAVRFMLWRHALEAIASSPLFGLGPGAHSGYEGPFYGIEAHNTFLDWGASTGLFGISLYLAFIFNWLKESWSSRRTILFVSVIFAVCFSVFHYVLRMPVFWFFMVWIMISTDDSDRQTRQLELRGGWLKWRNQTTYVRT